MVATIVGVAAIAGGAVATLHGLGEAAVGVVVLLLGVGWGLRTSVRASDVLAIGVALLLLVPARYRIEPLASLGTPASLIGLLALGAWALGLVTGRPRLAPGSWRVRALVGALLCSTFAAYLAAGFRVHDDLEGRGADRGLLALLSVIGLTLLAAEVVTTRAELRRIVAVVTSCGAVVAFLGVLQFALGVDVAGIVRPPGFTFAAVDYDSSRSGFARIVSTVSHPIELSVVLTVVLPLTLWLLTTSTGRARTWWTCCLVVTGAAVPMTVSRTGVAALAVAALVVVPTWTWRERRRAAVIGMVALAGYQVLVPGLLGTLRALLFDAADDPSLASRVAGRERAAAFISERPLLGRGPGTFLPERYGFLDNQVLATLVETGVVGLVAYALLFGTVAGLLVATVTRSRRAGREEDRALAVALLAGTAVSVATWATYDALAFPTGRALTFVVLGLAVAVHRIAGRAPRRAEMPSHEALTRDILSPTQAVASRPTGAP